MSDDDKTTLAEQFGPPPKEGVWFRGFIGILVVVAGLVGLGALYVFEVPTGNREPLLLALGIVLGWGSSVVSSEYGATTTGRKVADVVTRRLEQEGDTAVADAKAKR